MTKILEAARALVSAGIHIFPTTTDTKVPTVDSWTAYKTRFPTDAELVKWFGSERPKSIGVPAGRIFCLDIDQKHEPHGRNLYDDFCARCKDAGVYSLIERAYVQSTMAGGWHIVFAVESPERFSNQKLASVAAEGPLKKAAIFETRGEGGYFLAAPSAGYTAISGDLDFLPVFSDEEVSSILSVAKTFDEMPDVRAEPPKQAAEPRQSPNGDVSPLDDYDARGDLPGLLRAHGWFSREGKYWRRPGKERGFSATLNMCPGMPNRFYVFSTSTQFEDRKVYKPSAVLAMLEHGGDFKATATALVKQGYGTRRTHQQSQCLDLRPKAAVEAKAPQEPPYIDDGLPPFYTIEEEDEADWPRPPELVSGILYQGAKMMIAGPSKARKTFLMTDLAASVGAGVPWLGFPCAQAPVLYLNLELQNFAFRDRRQEIVEAKLSAGVKTNIISWHLRGQNVTFDRIRARMLSLCKLEGVGLVIIDPTYKLNQDGSDENNAGDVGRWLNALEALGEQTKAAIVWSHHFAKGNASGKESIDRASGSGVWARDPDALITMTPHEEKECMTLEATLRNFKPVEPFVIRWDYPLWQRDLTADPADVKQPKKASQSAGRPTLGIRDLKDVLADFGGAVTRENVDQIAAALGCSVPTVWRRWKSLKDNN